MNSDSPYQYQNGTDPSRWSWGASTGPDSIQRLTDHHGAVIAQAQPEIDGWTAVPRGPALDWLDRSPDSRHHPDDAWNSHHLSHTKHQAERNISRAAIAAFVIPDPHTISKVKVFDVHITARELLAALESALRRTYGRAYPHRSLAILPEDHQTLQQPNPVTQAKTLAQATALTSRTIPPPLHDRTPPVQAYAHYVAQRLKVTEDGIIIL